jgi:outer membrane protein assembly factor BamB
VPSDLPDGWKPWRAKADGPSPGGFPFNGCAAVGTSLVCAGADLMAARWNLADGGRAWSRLTDPTPDDTGSSESGDILGVRGDDVLVFGDDEPSGDDSDSVARHTVESLDAATGKVNWRTVTGEGPYALVPADRNTAVVDEGVITLYGDQADMYALIDADDGEVRWKRPMTAYSGLTTLETAGKEAYLLLQPDDREEDTARTTVMQLDPKTGESRWSVEAKGDLKLLGEDKDGRLVLADEYDEDPHLTLIDPATRAVRRTALTPAPPAGYRSHMVAGTVYLAWDSGTLRAFTPHTGRRLWENNSTVEHPGPPAASATHVYVASTSGRMAALDIRTGDITATRPGHDDADSRIFAGHGARPLLVGDALYIPYGSRSVYTVDVNNL